MLEVHATWEPPAGSEGSRLARLFKKRRGGSPVDVVRRTSLAVVAGGGPAPVTVPGAEAISDSLDLTRARGQRAMASGRGPAPGGPGGGLDDAGSGPRRALAARPAARLEPVRAAARARSSRRPTPGGSPGRRCPCASTTPAAPIA